jgi:hypothetical protein
MQGEEKEFQLVELCSTLQAFKGDRRQRQKFKFVPHQRYADRISKRNDSEFMQANPLLEYQFTDHEQVGCPYLENF